MKSPLCRIFGASLFLLALLAAPSRGAGPSIETRVTRLNELVVLTAAQNAQVADVFRREDAELAALTSADRPLKTFETRQASRDRVRALLTTAQKQIYDRTPQPRGGGLTMATPEARLANLAATVVLTPAQKTVALRVFQEEFDSLIALDPADRSEKGMPYRQASRDQVRALLTPEQRDTLDHVRQAVVEQSGAERMAVENLLRASSALVARIGAIASFTPAGSSTTQSSDGSRKGTLTLRAVGNTGSETLVVSWEKLTSSADLRITRVEGSGGQLIGL